MISSVANVINLIIEHWEISLFAFAVFAAVCLGLFKGVKHGVRALFAVLVIASCWVVACLVYYFVMQDTDGLIKFCIAWLPTIIFLIIVLTSTLIGVRRGLRKSLILLTHSLITAGLCIGAFFFCINSPDVDRLTLELINVFMGEGGLQSALGVSSKCDGIREVAVNYIGSVSVDWGEFGILLRENSAYVLTLVNMAYRIAFALVLFIVYQLLNFIMFLVYVFCYPERRYRKKRNMRFANQKTDTSYKKRPVGGGCVGMARGLATGVIAMSFAGSVFFVAAGGAGASKLPDDVSFGEQYDQFVSIYRSIEDYGEQGIFKVLNSISDPEDTPYYLFAADLVFSGGLDDTVHGVSGNVSFREELAAYSGFAKDTLALLMKYDADGEINAILGGNTEDAMDKILSVCSNSEFMVEFNNLIDNFDAKTYVINFALSLVDSVISNIDSMSFTASLSADNKELLQLLFTRGYLCEVIPDERELKQQGADVVQPHLTVNRLFTKKDAQTVLNIVLSIITDDTEGEDSALKLARAVMPQIEELSVFSTERSGEMDPVLGRLYCYFDNKFLTDEGEEGIRYSEVKDESVYWTREIRALLGVSDGLFAMYDKVHGDSILNNLVDMFDVNSPDYDENSKTYEEVVSVAADSALLGKVLSSKKVSRFLQTQLGAIADDIYFPENVVYENAYDKDGNLVSHGEAYQLLRGLRLLAQSENKSLVDALSDDTLSFEDLLRKLSATITKDDPLAHGNSLASYMTESVLLRSALSSVIIERAGDMLVIPALSCEAGSDGRLINKYELREIFEAVPELTELIIPLAGENVSAAEINAVLESSAFNALIDNGNKIVEGTIAKAMVDMFSNHGTIIISKRLEDCEEWVTVGTPGELRRFLDVIDILTLDVEELMDGGALDGSEIFDKLKKLDADSIDRLLSSDVFYYSASKMMVGGDFRFENFEVIVPASSCNVLIGDKLDKVVKRDELSSVFIELTEFGLSSDMSNEKIIRKLVEQKEVLNKSNVISASVVNFIVENEDICSALSIPKLYMDAGARDRLDNYDSTNVWRSELPDMTGAIDEIFGISQMSEDEEFIFDDATVNQKVKGLIGTLNDGSVSCPETSLTRLDVIYKSDIAVSLITDNVRDAFAENGLVYHPAANRTDLDVLKRQEIDALVALLGGGDVDGFDVGTVSLGLIKDWLSDGNGSTKSFLIAGNFADMLVSNISLYVPSGVYSNGLINAYEAVSFIDALIAMQGEKSFDDWTVEDYMRLPDREVRMLILQSAIMRATFSHHVFTHENNSDLIFAQTSIEEDFRVTAAGVTGARIASVSVTQLEALFEIIENCTEDDGLGIPSFDSVEDIIRLGAHIETLYLFDATRYRISDVIINSAGLGASAYTEQCHRFIALGGSVGWTSVSVPVLPREVIDAIIGGRI